MKSSPEITRLEDQSPASLGYALRRSMRYIVHGAIGFGIGFLPSLWFLPHVHPNWTYVVFLILGMVVGLTYGETRNKSFLLIGLVLFGLLCYGYTIFGDPLRHDETMFACFYGVVPGFLGAWLSRRLAQRAKAYSLATNTPWWKITWFRRQP